MLNFLGVNMLSGFVGFHRLTKHRISTEAKGLSGWNPIYSIAPEEGSLWLVVHEGIDGLSLCSVTFQVTFQLSDIGV